MIVLQRIDLLQGIAEFTALSGKRTGIDLEFQRVLERAQEVGLHEIQLRYPDGSVKQHSLAPPEQQAQQVDGASAPANSVATQPVKALHMTDPIVHGWTLDHGLPTYDVTIKHAPESMSRLSAYLNMVLVTFGHKIAHLLQLRLALYEIYSNIIEHGHVGKAEPQIQVHLQFKPDEIQGWIQDECKQFDTLSAAVTAIPDKMAHRHRRGYGITMIRQFLDTVDYEFNTRGNRITFSKRISR